MDLLQVLCFFLGAFLAGVGATILVLANASKRQCENDPCRDRVEGCLTFVFGALPTLMGCIFLIGAAVLRP